MEQRPLITRRVAGLYISDHAAWRRERTNAFTTQCRALLKAPSGYPFLFLSFSVSPPLLTPCRLLFHFSLQPLAPFFGRVACSLPCERTSCSCVYTRAYTTLLSILPYQTDAQAFIFSRSVAYPRLSTFDALS